MSEKFKSIQRVKKLVKKLNPIDDIIFRKMAESREFCEEILKELNLCQYIGHKKLKVFMQHR